jgi:hypothetical protein
MRTKYVLLMLAVFFALSSCHNPWMERILKKKPAQGDSAVFLTSIEAVRAYLEQAEEPVSLRLAIPLGTMPSEAWQEILVAIADGDKNVSLDLSACTMTGTVFNPEPTDPPGKDKIVSITLPRTATSIADISNANAYVFENFTALESVSGGPALASISDKAFAFCYSLKSVSMPGLTTIGENAFNTCSALTSVSMPLLTTIGQSGFVGCTSLASISLPRVTSVGEKAFNACDSLNSVDLPAVKDIGIEAFFGCGMLAQITLPASLEIIGRAAFRQCSSLTTVTCHAVNPPVWYKENDGSSISSSEPNVGQIFAGVPAALNIYVPAASVQQYKDNADWNPTSSFTNRIFAIVP